VCLRPSRHFVYLWEYRGEAAGSRMKGFRTYNRSSCLGVLIIVIFGCVFLRVKSIELY
jgi:hypothetical protein